MKSAVLWKCTLVLPEQVMQQGADVRYYFYQSKLDKNTSTPQRARKTLLPEQVATLFSLFVRKASTLSRAGPSFTISTPNLPNDSCRGIWRQGRHPCEHEDILSPPVFFYCSLSFSPSSCCSSSLIREGVLTSPAAEVWPTGWLGDLKALFGMHCPPRLRLCKDVRVYCLQRQLGEGCSSDKGCWRSLADPSGPFTSCQSLGPQRGALPSALPQPGHTQQGAR